MPAKTRRPKRLGRPPKRSRRPGEPSSKEKILEAASTLFADRGIDATTMEDVAERAGFTVGALYRHFEGKPGLLLAVVEGALDRIPQFHQDAEPPRGTLAEAVGLYVTRDLDEVRRLAREVHAAARGDERVRALLDEFNGRVRRALAERIAASGSADPSTPPDVAADLLLVVIMGLTHLDTLAPDRADRPAFRAAVERAVERILGIDRTAGGE